MKLTVLCLLMVATLCGCVVTVPGHLYPVQGPLAAEKPLPVFKLSRVQMGQFGSISVTLLDGEVCHGNLETIPLDHPSDSTMQEAWDRVYGSGYFVAKVLGKPGFRVMLAGTHGTHLQAELGNPSMMGVARDDKGNLYKVVF